jgi:hypothetical protein
MTQPERDKSGTAAGGKNSADEVGRYLTLLAEGAAMNVPEYGDDASYKKFRTNVGGLTQRISDKLPKDDKLELIQQIVHEFEGYRKVVEDEFRDRRVGWRALTATMLQYILGLLTISPVSTEAAPLVQRVGSLLTGAEIQAFQILLTEFLRLGGEKAEKIRAARIMPANSAEINHNAAGLRGSAAAVEHIQGIMDREVQGFVVLFRLGCMEVIGERFGEEAVQDSLMAVAAFLTNSLRSDDVIYHWSDSSLLAVLQTPASQPVIVSAIQRVVNSNRDITIQTGGHAVMVRIPLDSEVTPISRLHVADDLYKLLPEQTREWAGR